jgi:hypothetical protein
MYSNEIITEVTYLVLINSSIDYKVYTNLKYSLFYHKCTVLVSKITLPLSIFTTMYYCSTFISMVLFPSVYQSPHMMLFFTIMIPPVDKLCCFRMIYFHFIVEVLFSCFFILFYIMLLGRRRRDGTVVGFTTTCVISACHQQGCEVESRSSRGVPDTILCDKVCQ